MGRIKYKNYRKKYKKITIEELIDKFQLFCISYTVIYILTSILGLLSKISDNIFFQWCGIISIFLSFPMSQSDLLIMIFGVHWLLFALGLTFLCYKLYKLIN